MGYRAAFMAIWVLGLVSLLMWWQIAVGFEWSDKRWWVWLLKSVKITGTLPAPMLQAVYITGGLVLFLLVAVFLLSSRPGSTTVIGGRKAKELHGTARWAGFRDIKKTGFLRATGVVIGGIRKFGQKVLTLRHDGPEHLLCFAPTRSGKGVGLIIPTLLSWRDSVICLDIKGENFAKTAGWRRAIGQRVIRFDPSALEGSARYNPMVEIRLETAHEIADCQNLASMIIDPDGKGLKDYWQQSGWEWLAACILHVSYFVKKTEGRPATIADVYQFMSVGQDEEETGNKAEDGDESFDRLCDEMAAFNHGRESVHQEIKRAAASMKKKASQERSGVHSSAKVQLALYSDPIVSRNISTCDFRIADLMNGARPTSLYIVMPPSDQNRLRPLFRILINQILSRLTSEMAFEAGKEVKGYKHRLLLLMDEFTSIGKLEIFENALAYMAGYGLKAFLIVQDLTQLNKTYGRDNSIMANCHTRIAYAPNTIDTAETLSKLAGKTTIVQRKRSKSGRSGDLIGSGSESLTETSRPLLTPDECMTLRAAEKDRHDRITRAGDMLIFPAGHHPILGTQPLYFQDKELVDRAALPPPVHNMAGPTKQAKIKTRKYEDYLNGSIENGSIENSCRLGQRQNRTGTTAKPT